MMTGKEFGDSGKEECVKQIIVFLSRACQGKEEEGWGDYSGIYVSGSFYSFVSSTQSLEMY